MLLFQIILTQKTQMKNKKPSFKKITLLYDIRPELKLMHVLTNIFVSRCLSLKNQNKNENSELNGLHQ